MTRNAWYFKKVAVNESEDEDEAMRPTRQLETEQQAEPETSLRRSTWTRKPVRPYQHGNWSLGQGKHIAHAVANLTKY
mgnify:CR=1 FL=1